MAPKRTTSNTNKTAASTSTNHDEVDGKSVQWQWLSDDDWTSFDADHSNSLSAQFSKSQATLLSLTSDLKLKISFDQMMQTNTSTSASRKIRFCIRNSNDFYSWMWENENGNWNSYPATTALQLEEAFISGQVSPIKMKTAANSYEICIDTMKQTNVATKVERNVARQKCIDGKGKDAASSKVGGRRAPTRKAASNPPASSASTSNLRRSARSTGYKGKENDSEEEVEVPVKKAKSSKSRRSKKSKALDEDEEDSTVKEEDDTRTYILKGKAPIDPECTSMIGKAHVFSDSEGIWDCMLNQTNLQFNNNKYYLIQLLERDSMNSFSVWMRWGRVGKTGQTTLISCGSDLVKAKNFFTKKFRDKTSHDWTNRATFTKTAGKYDMVELDYSVDVKDEPDSKMATGGDVEKPKVPNSVLDQHIQDLMTLICDVKSMEQAVIEMKYDTKKAPLGKLTQQQIKAGFAALKRIDSCIEGNDFGPTFIQACNDFYTRIPHAFGMKTPPTIRTKQHLKEKMLLLEALGDIEIALKIIKASSAEENPIDAHYKELKCKMETLDSGNDDFLMVKDYVANTHAATHSMYKLKVLDVFKLEKEGEAERFNKLDNRMLLWHGSRLTNWVGILSQGLRIAPPEAPVTGYMFGKGIYFADMSSKSANYCFTTSSKNIGILLLCEVSLGNMNELLAADYKADVLPAGKHSTKGMGRVAPDAAKNLKMSDGVVVPLGKGTDTGVSNPGGYSLNYNEYIVYNTNQIRFRYLVKVEFCYNF